MLPRRAMPTRRCRDRSTTWYVSVRSTALVVTLHSVRSLRSTSTILRRTSRCSNTPIKSCRALSSIGIRRTTASQHRVYRSTSPVNSNNCSRDTTVDPREMYASSRVESIPSALCENSRARRSRRTDPEIVDINRPSARQRPPLSQLTSIVFSCRAMSFPTSIPVCFPRPARPRLLRDSMPRSELAVQTSLNGNGQVCSVRDVLVSRPLLDTHTHTH